MLLGKLGTPSGSANLRWEQWENRFSIRLWGPMGQATTLITGDVRRVVLERADGGERRVGDPAVILKEELGWEIPVGALGYWVRGVPAPDGAATNLQLSEGRAAAFGQNGWHIEVSRYMAVAGRSLPARITAARGEHRVTLVIREWHLGDAAGDGAHVIDAPAGAQVDGAQPGAQLPAEGAQPGAQLPAEGAQPDPP